MDSFVSLRKTGSGWEFESETILEDFVWVNLQQLLGLIPLKRQYRVSGQICDIVAVDDHKRLVLLELKNGEDRYIVQQLTRYYDALLDQKAFNAEIDYSQPVRLVAIAPSFHRDNFTDRKYSHLSIELFKFAITADGEQFYLQFKDTNDNISQLEIHYQVKASTENVTPPPKKLLNFLSKCEKSSDKERENVLKIRHKLLSFDSRMQEFIQANKIEYGKGKNQMCAEFYLGKNSYGYPKPSLFLRLLEPSPYYRRRQSILRMFIWTEEDWYSFSRMQYFPRAFIYDKVISSSRFEFPSFLNIIKLRVDSEVEDERPRKCYQIYEKLIVSETNSLEILVEIALETWLKRL